MRPPGARRSTAWGREAVSSSSSRLTAIRSAWNVLRAGWGPPRRAPSAPATILASSSVVAIGARDRARARLPRAPIRLIPKNV